MQTKSKISILIALAALAAFGIWRVLFPPAVSDSDQILNQIGTMAGAAQNRQISGVMQGISEHYGDDFGLTVDSLKFELARTMRESSKINVDFDSPRISIKGDLAVSEMNVKITCFGDASGESSSITTPLKLQWKKETGTRFLVIPASVWRVTHASYQYGFPGD